MSDQKISSLLAGRVPEGDQVTIKGWVRTRRDSKAGLAGCGLELAVRQLRGQCLEVGTPGFLDRDDVRPQRMNELCEGPGVDLAIP